MHALARASLLAALVSLPALAAEDPLPASVFAADFGRYGPGGDCSKGPRVEVAASGLVITVDGQAERLAKFDIAWTYSGPDYQGASHWLFPYGGGDTHPVLMTLSADETPGKMRVEAYDHGWKGGPPLSKRHQALVDGSPYRRCD